MSIHALTYNADSDNDLNVTDADAATAGGADPFLRRLSPATIDTILRCLSTSDRLIVQTTSKAFMTVVQESTLWREYQLTYVHDSETATPLVEKPSPFAQEVVQASMWSFDNPVSVDTTSQENKKNKIVRRPDESGWLIKPSTLTESVKKPDDGGCAFNPAALPPPWIRNLTHRLRVYTVEHTDLTILLSQFHSIRSLHLHRPIRGVQLDSMRSALISLHQLEELIVEKYDRELVTVLFGSRISLGAAFFPSMKAKNDEPAIWSWCDSLTHLQFKVPTPSAHEFTSFRYFAFAMSQRVWKRLELLRCLWYIDPDDVATTKSTRMNCEKFISHECLPQIKFFSIGGYVTTEFLASQYAWLYSCGELPSLLSLHHDFDLCLEPKTLPFQIDAVLKRPGPQSKSKQDATTTSTTTTASSVVVDSTQATANSTSITYPLSLTHLHSGNFGNWESIARLRQLTRLILINLPEVESRPMFEAIGHHNLPHLATLSVPCRDELYATPADRDRVLELMSNMTSLTALHSESVTHNPILTNAFNWFRYLYLFSSLKLIAFIRVPRPVLEYRTVPLPLPVDVTLTAEQIHHPLYPDGGVNLAADEVQDTTPASLISAPLLSPLMMQQPRSQQQRLSTPDWMRVLEFNVNSEKEVSFRDSQRDKLIDADRFCTGGLMQYHPRTPQVSRSEIGQIREDVFASVMTDLCMVTMLKFLTIYEQVGTISVSQYFRSSVYHTALWRHLTLKMSESSHGLPSREICRVLGGYACDSLDATRELIHFHHVKRLHLHIPRMSSNRQVHHALSALRLEKLSLTLERTDTHKLTARSAVVDSARAGGLSIFDAFFLPSDSTQVENGSGRPNSMQPLISVYSSSLRHLALMASLVSLEDAAIMSQAMTRQAQCVWSHLHTFRLFVDDENQLKFTHDSELSFEEVLIRSSHFLPQLTELEFSVILGEGDLPLRALERIFTALSESKSLIRLTHCFCPPLLLSKQPFPSTYQQHYPPRLKSLTIKNQFVPWSALRSLHSLTELRLLGERRLGERLALTQELTPGELFDLIGSHSMPHLAYLSILVRTHEYQTAEECALESKRVCTVMSQMSSLTSLHSEALIYEFNLDESPTHFNWFAHAYLFSSLQRIEYAHQIFYDFDVYETTRGTINRHTLLPIPRDHTNKSKPFVVSLTGPVDDASLSQPALLQHHLLPGPAFTPPHIYRPAVFTQWRIRYICQDIVMQSAYEHTSVDELRIVQQDAFEKGIDIPLHDVRAHPSTSGESVSRSETTFQVRHASDEEEELKKAIESKNAWLSAFNNATLKMTEPTEGVPQFSTWPNAHNNEPSFLPITPQAIVSSGAVATPLIVAPATTVIGTTTATVAASTSSTVGFTGFSGFQFGSTALTPSTSAATPPTVAGSGPSGASTVTNPIVGTQPSLSTTAPLSSSTGTTSGFSGFSGFQFGSTKVPTVAQQVGPSTAATSASSTSTSTNTITSASLLAPVPVPTTSLSAGFPGFAGFQFGSNVASTSASTSSASATVALSTQPTTAVAAAAASSTTPSTATLTTGFAGFGGFSFAPTASTASTTATAPTLASQSASLTSEPSIPVVPTHPPSSAILPVPTSTAGFVGFSGFQFGSTSALPSPPPSAATTRPAATFAFPSAHSCIPFSSTFAAPIGLTFNVPPVMTSNANGNTASHFASALVSITSAETGCGTFNENLGDSKGRSLCKYS